MKKKSTYLIAAVVLVLIIIFVCFSMMNKNKDYNENFGVILKQSGYQTCVRVKDIDGLDYRYDVKKVYKSFNKTRLVNYAEGYYVDFPGNVNFDFSLSGAAIKGAKKDFEVFVSRETSPYDDVSEYIDSYINKIIISKDYQTANNITLHEDSMKKIGDRYVRMISVTRTPGEQSDITANSYSYAYILDENSPKVYYRIMVKEKKYNKKAFENIVKSFVAIDKVGATKMKVVTKPVLPKWNEETRIFYENLVNRTDVLWGVYTPKLITAEGMSTEITTLENKLDNKFKYCMGYTNLDEEPPIQGLTQAYNDGKITEMTLQISTIDHQGMDSTKNPNFQVLDGEKDDQIRKYAKAFKKFAHPILFRVNNEMNTDWCSYSGVATMQDPEIYKQVHTRIFNIFAEEEVDNIIWIFNPQYGNYPPASFNNYMSYYPGNSQIQVFGVTKYNTGNYYADVFGEKWEEFDVTYKEVENYFMQNFPDIPWVITEFASSSYGGDKAKWIETMFNTIGDFKNIKAAIWYNSGDRDFREDKKGAIARPYYLDETPETLQAFKDGLKKSK